MRITPAKIILLSVVMLIMTCPLQAVDVTTNPFIGVTHIHRTLSSPRPLNINIAMIDLAAEGISFKATPSNGSAGGETNLQTVKAFVEQENAQIGINGGFFFWDNNVSGCDVMGYAASNGDTYSYFTQWSGWPTPYVSLNISSTNQANIIYPVPSFPIGQYVAPLGVEVYNAIAGSEWIVRNGVKNVSNWDINTALHPRSAAGITDNNVLVLLTVDGRQNGFSEGMYVSEVADLLLEFDVTQGINLDGGGSSTMVFADPTARLINVPINGGTPYSMRSTGNNLAVFAQINTQPVEKIIFNSFESGDEGTFAYAPGYSGSTAGIIAANSTAAAVETDAWNGSWAELITIADNPALTAVADNPQGGWFVRWVSGASASPSQNISRPLEGYVGLWLKTSSPDVRISICLDNDSQMERGLPLAVNNDGYWHCYQWNLEDAAAWEGWYNGDDELTGSTFTLDSIQIFGPDADVELYIDDICHSPDGSLDVLATCGQLWKSGLGDIADINQDCIVDITDLSIMCNDWLQDDSLNNIVGDARIDLHDFGAISENWLNDRNPESEE